MQPIRWGIIGTGGIAKNFAAGLATLPDARLAAVGSRSLEAAKGFAAQFAVPRPHASYQSLVADEEVDAVYIAVPHPFHASCALFALAAGKHVLCEKPFTMNARQAEEVIRAARANKLLLMEAMWTRFFPVMAQLRELLAEGAIGRVRYLSAVFSFRAKFSAESRLFNPALGGGALLDVGVYTVSLASMVLGKPSQIRGAAEIGATGVDYQTAMLFQYSSGAVASLYAGLRSDQPADVEILGETGAIKILAPFWKPSRMTLSRANGNSREFDKPYPGNGMQFEAAEFMNCLREGRLESPLMPLDESLSIMRRMDDLRKQWKLRYPGE